MAFKKDVEALRDMPDVDVIKIKVGIRSKWVTASDSTSSSCSKFDLAFFFSPESQ